MNENASRCMADEHDWPITQFVASGMLVSGLCWKCGMSATQLVEQQAAQALKRACELSEVK